MSDGSPSPLEVEFRFEGSPTASKFQKQPVYLIFHMFDVRVMSFRLFTVCRWVVQHRGDVGTGTGGDGRQATHVGGLLCDV